MRSEDVMSLLCRIAVVVGLLMLGGALGLALGSGLYAADLPLVPHSRIQHHAPTRATSGPDRGTPLEEFAKGPNAACTAWTDGCRTCGKGSDGVFCSNIAIACVPTEPRCTRP